MAADGSTFTVEKLDSALGALVQGVDLRDSLEPTTVEALRRALFEHQVLFFRDQSLTDEQHLQFAAQFGAPNLYPLVEMLGGQKPIEIVADGGDRKPVAAAWHTDVTWLQDPPKLGVLSAQVMPAQGGDTLWCSLYAVYEALPRTLREQVDDLAVAHSPGEGFYDRVVGSLGDADFVDRFKARYGEGSTHPLVRDHYVTGRRLIYLAGAFMDHVVGMEIDEGRALLRKLVEFADDDRFHVRWDWQVNDLALWDERSTMHRVDASHWPEKRVMRRCTMS